IQEGMQIGVDCDNYQTQSPRPAKIDPPVTVMQAQEKPDVTYASVGGCKCYIEKLGEIVETLLL
ncbi:hypothetical protein Angca_002731, partial [Angiostrongylus cantonensis]